MAFAMTLLLLLLHAFQDSRYPRLKCGNEKFWHDPNQNSKSMAALLYLIPNYIYFSKFSHVLGAGESVFELTDDKHKAFTTSLSSQVERKKQLF